MADDKKGREDQARNAEKRQRQRVIAEELERWDETEPPVETADARDVEGELESLDFPVAGAEVVTAVGDLGVEFADGPRKIEELIPDTDTEIYETPAAVRMRIQRPTIAAAMKRIVEAIETLQSPDFDESRRKGYEKTLRALKAIDADDEDEGIRAVTDWIVDRIHDTETLPSSRAVRKQAAEFCRANGYEVRNDEWLGR